jgi:hypothetical protein
VVAGSGWAYLVPALVFALYLQRIGACRVGGASFLVGGALVLGARVPHARQLLIGQRRRRL